MLSTKMDANEACRQVGYLSASRFSREYGRYFGNAPTRDIERLREQGLTAADVTRNLPPVAVAKAAAAVQR